MKPISIDVNEETGFGEQLPNSLVAVMDIMGFSAMIQASGGMMTLVENGLAVTACMGAVRHVQGFMAEVQWPCSTRRAMAFQDKVNSNLANIQHFQFSDTIVFLLPKVKKGDTTALFAFVATVLHAVYDCFWYGFPVRCQIEFGDCLRNRNENFLLGKPFIDAHEKSEQIGYSGIAISEKTMEVFRTAVKGTLPLPSVCEILGIERLSSPDKFGVYSTMWCVDWMKCRYDNAFNICCFRQELVERFTAHGKTLSESVVKKIDNTEIVMRQFVAKAKAFREAQSYYQQPKEIGEFPYCCKQQGVSCQKMTSCRYQQVSRGGKHE